MNFYLFGINHNTASIDVREKFFFTSADQNLFLSEARNNPAIAEALIISTCNRTEIYLHIIDGCQPFAMIHKMICQIKKSPYTLDDAGYFYIKHGKEAVRHLFKVATGLDSLVLGEKQILGQLKTAIGRAREMGTFSKFFNVLTNSAIRSGKKAHNETTISHGGSSVSWAAIAKGEEALGTLSDIKILIIGAGKMGELALSQIQKKGFSKLYLMNRTEAIAKRLAEQYGGEAVSFCDIKEILAEVDMCICSAGAPHYILEPSIMHRVMPQRQNRELVLLDISMPRNIDPTVSQVPNVHLYEIDDLKEVVEANMLKRKEAIDQVQDIVDDKVNEFYVKIAKLTQVKSEFGDFALTLKKGLGYV